MADKPKMLSTTALAKQQNALPKELFAKLVESGLMKKEDDAWVLTDSGKQKGGTYKESKQYGRYIVWPENLDISDKKPTTKPSNNTLTATAIGKHFNLSANRTNYIISELGWSKKGLKGWLVTEQGKKQGGSQQEDRRTGIPYIRWTESILSSKILTDTISHVKGTNESTSTQGHNKDGFRGKFEAKHRATDGHFVRSKAEMLVDNWLYMAEIVHAYERRLPIEESVYSDFYIPTGKVYIEYWGYENNSKYLARKKKKIEIYKKYGFNLIELNDDDVQNLDDILPRLLLKFGVKAY